MNTLEFIAVFVFPVILFGIALYQWGKGSGHWFQNFFQATVYIACLALYVLMIKGVVSIPVMIYYLLTGIAFLTAFLLEILYVKTGETSKLDKVVVSFMFLHVCVFLVYNIMVAWS